MPLIDQDDGGFTKLESNDVVIAVAIDVDDNGCQKGIASQIRWKYGGDGFREGRNAAEESACGHLLLAAGKQKTQHDGQRDQQEASTHDDMLLANAVSMPIARAILASGPEASWRGGPSWEPRTRIR